MRSSALRFFHRASPVLYCKRSYASFGASGKDRAGLIFANMCKNFLASHWRGQLTTLKPPPMGRIQVEIADRVFTSAASYAFIGGKPVIYLPNGGQHGANLLIDDHASLVVGHMDPYLLMKALKGFQKVPPRAVFMGSLRPVGQDEMFELVRIKESFDELIASAWKVLEESKTQVRSILEDAASLFGEREQALSSMKASDEEEAFYQLNVSSCHFVDILGRKNDIKLADVLDDKEACLSPFLPMIIEGINQSTRRRVGLMMFCTRYLNVRVEDALILSADKYGLDILGKVLIESPEALLHEHLIKNSKMAKVNAEVQKFEWRPFRLDFPKAIADLNEFCSMLVHLEKECLKGLERPKVVDIETNVG